MTQGFLLPLTIPPLARGAQNPPGLGLCGAAGFSDQDGKGMIPFLSSSIKCFLFCLWGLTQFKGYSQTAVHPEVSNHSFA